MFSVFSSYILFFVSAFDFFFFTSHPRYTTRHAPHAFISSYLYVYIPLLPFLTTPQDFFFYMFSMCVFFLNFFLVKLAFCFFFDCDSLFPPLYDPVSIHTHARIYVSFITSYPRLSSRVWVLCISLARLLSLSGFLGFRVDSVYSRPHPRVPRVSPQGTKYIYFKLLNS